MAGGCWRGAVQALVLVASQAHVVTDYVQSTHHLAENQHPARTAAVEAHTTALMMHSGRIEVHRHNEPVGAALREGSADV